jgi:hypothetical protein
LLIDHVLIQKFITGWQELEISLGGKGAILASPQTTVDSARLAGNLIPQKKRGNRSRAGGDKRIVPENHGERQESQYFGEDDKGEARGNFSSHFSLSGGQHFGK